MRRRLEIPTDRKSRVAYELQWGRRVNATETDHGEPRTTARGPLQWGRRVNATETDGTFGLQQLAQAAASMGPSRECDGDDALELRPSKGAPLASMGPSRECDGDRPPRGAGRLPRPFTLQWGRRVNATETGRRGWCTAGATSLQWGRRVNATETTLPGVPIRGQLPASMGPSRECDGDWHGRIS